MMKSLTVGKKVLFFVLSFLFCLSAYFAPVTFAESTTPPPEQEKAVAVYTITEPELTTLERNLSELRATNTSLQMKSDKQEARLKELQAEIERLRNLLKKSAAASETQAASLTNANKLLDGYATEAKKERLRIKAQRNTWGAIAACLAVALVAKNT